jgi:predicted permease
MKRIKFAFRMLAKTPSVTIIAIISLALGIGSTTAIFSMFHQMLLQPLPVPQPDRLVNLGAPAPKPGNNSCNMAGSCDEVFSYPMFRDLEKSQTVFTGIAAHVFFGANLAYSGQTTTARGMLVSGSYFPVLGIQPAFGRLIGPGDDRAIGESPVVVLSHAYWRTRFEGNSGVLNQTMTLNGEQFTIIGVAPAGFDGTTLAAMPDIYAPITMRGFSERDPKRFEDRRSYWAYLFARLKTGVSIEQARAAINVQYHAIINDVEVPLQKGMSEKTLTRFRAKQVTLEPGSRGQSSLHTEAQTPLTMLLGVTGLVLLIACANIANLLLARAASRAGEMAVRLSVGASRKQLISQLLSESCLLAVLGGVAGLIVARWTVDFVSSLLPKDMPLQLDFALNWPVLLFAAVATLGTGVAFGLIPALHSTRPDVLSSLKGQTGQTAGARSAARFRAALAITQIALAMMLLVSAGLFTKSLYKVSRVELGLKTENMITFEISPNLNGYKPEQSRALFERLENELRAQPGVTAVTAAQVAVLSGDNWGNSVRVQGFAAGPDTDSNSRYNGVGPGFFRTMGTSLIAGREFTDADAAGAPKVAIVNEQFAKKFNLGHDAVGKRMSNNSSLNAKELDLEIVGLVQNAKYSEVKQEIPPVFFLPYRQNDGTGDITFYVRTQLDAKKALSMVQPLVARLDPNLPVSQLRTLEQTVQSNVAPDRIVTMLSAAFASLATVLAAIGLYAVLAYTVAQRTREFGLRMALGAAPARVQALVLRQVGMMTIVGSALGLAAAVGLGHLAESILYQIKGYDASVLGLSFVVLALVSIIAGFVPAYRASLVDPMQALHYE